MPTQYIHWIDTTKHNSCFHFSNLVKFSHTAATTHIHIHTYTHTEYFREWKRENIRPRQMSTTYTHTHAHSLTSVMWQNNNNTFVFLLSLSENSCRFFCHNCFRTKHVLNEKLYPECFFTLNQMYIYPQLGTISPYPSSLHTRTHACT